MWVVYSSVPRGSPAKARGTDIKHNSQSHSLNFPSTCLKPWPLPRQLRERERSAEKAASETSTSRFDEVYSEALDSEARTHERTHQWVISAWEPLSPRQREKKERERARESAELNPLSSLSSDRQLPRPPPLWSQVSRAEAGMQQALNADFTPPGVSFLTRHRAASLQKRWFGANLSSWFVW